MNTNNIAANLKRIRTEKNLSIEKLSRKTGIQHGVITQYEAGFVTPGLPFLIKLAKALDVLTDDLLASTQPRQSESQEMARAYKNASEYQKKRVKEALFID